MLNSIQLTRFKCYNSVQKASFSQFNILYGKNGRGKSTLIQPLLLLSQTLREQNNVDYLYLQGSLTRLGSFVDVATRCGDDISEFEINVNAEGDDMRLSFIRDDGKPTLAKLSSINDGENSLMAEMGEKGGTISSDKGTVSQSALKSFAYLKRLRYVSANRLGPKNSEDRLDTFGESLLTPNGDNLFNVLSVLPNDIIEKIRLELTYVLSGASIRVVSTVDSIELFLDSANGQDQNGFKPLNVGYGYSFVLPIIYQIITAPSNTLLIIENPEAHLYPGAQSRLIEVMVKYAKEKNLQFIIETHSDHVINGLRISVKKKRINRQDVAILFFDRISDDEHQPRIEPIKIDQNGTLSNEPDDFMDEWTKQLMDLL